MSQLSVAVRVNDVVSKGRNFETKHDLEKFINRSSGQRLRFMLKKIRRRLKLAKAQVLRRYEEGCYTPERVAERVG
jgi:hypothetical protein